MGYTDTILDVKSQRVRALLGLTGEPGDKTAERTAEPMVNGTEPSSLKDSGMVRYESGRCRGGGRGVATPCLGVKSKLKCLDLTDFYIL